MPCYLNCVQNWIQYCVQNMCKLVLCWSEDYSSKVCFKNMTLRPSIQSLRVRQWGSGSVQVGKYWPSRAQPLAQWQTRIQGRGCLRVSEVLMLAEKHRQLLELDLGLNNLWMILCWTVMEESSREEEGGSEDSLDLVTLHIQVQPSHRHMSQSTSWPQ